MRVNLQALMTDAYGNYEQPTLLLTTLNDDAICFITHLLAFDANFQFNDVSEINISVPDKVWVDGELIDNPCYDELVGMRKIMMEPFGAFVTINPQINDDGSRRVKDVTCYSLEYTLNYKQTSPLQGTFQFHDPTGTSSDTITAMIQEWAPDWKFDVVPSKISSRYRTLDVSAQSVYSFLMNDCQSIYGAIFTFDTVNKIIHVQDAEAEVDTVNIHLTRDNLIMDQDIEELSDEIVTCLGVYGADDVDIRPVNPLASTKIYNLDYLIQLGDIPADVAEAWRAWQTKFAVYQRLFSDLYAQYYNNQLLLNTQNSKLVDLQGELSAMEAVMDTYKTDAGGDHAAEMVELQTQMAAKQAEVNTQQAAVDNASAQIEADQDMMAEITQLCSFKNNFTDEQLAIINLYLKEDTLQESSFVLSTVADSPVAIESIAATNPFTVEITKADLYRADDYVELTEEEITDAGFTAAEQAEISGIANNLSSSYLGHHFFNINTGYLELTNAAGTFDLTGMIINSTLSYSDTANADGSYDCMVALSVRNPIWNGDEVTYSNALFVASGQLTGFTYTADPNSVDTDAMRFALTGGIITLTCDSSIDMNVNALQELYKYGQHALTELAWPSYEFSIDSANFFAAKGFEQYQQEIELGKKVYIDFKDSFYLEPLLIGVQVDFMDIKELQLEFNSKIRSQSPENVLADLIGQTAKTAASLDASKFNYNAFHNSNIQNDVADLIEGALDIAKKNVINSVNQDILMNSQGIHLRKLLDPATGTFDPGEVRMTNGNIVFTNDSWNTASLAIGKIQTPDGASTMGIVAQSLIGEVLIGNKLLIEATGQDPVTGLDKVTHFRVDGQGASLANASFAIQGTSGNQILLDPNFGIIAGQGNLFTMGESQLIYDFIDENGDLIYDKALFKDYGMKMPQGSAFYFDIETGSLAFRGDIYANNGYFKGTVHATDGSFKGHVTAKSLDVSDAQITGLVVGERGVTISPNATISWGQVTGTDDVAYSSEIPTEANIESISTRISRDEISTASINASQITTGVLNANDIVIKGYLWDNVFGATNQVIIGVNQNNNLQVGTAGKAIANYKDVNIYAVDDINLMAGGVTDSNSAALTVYCNDTDGTTGVRIPSIASGGSNAGATANSYKLLACGSTGIVYATDTSLNDLADGKFKVTAVFG